MSDMDVKLSIGIKAYNEQTHIARCLESALAAIEKVGGEVILADSGSSDQTVEIGKRYPVRIVELGPSAKKSAAAGAQLAFQHARGEYYYMLDGDMVLSPEFVEAGIAFLEANPEYAGVGGRIKECNATNPEFLARQASMLKKPWWQVGDVDRLDCGGLYRAEAICQVGYFADKNLTVFEEFELGARLADAGWKLARIDQDAAEHYGHALEAYSLLWKRIQTGYTAAPGRVLRSALGKSHLPFVLKHLGHLRNGAAVMLWWCAIVASLFTPWGLALVSMLVLGPLFFLSLRRGSLSLGAYSLVAWNVTALGILTGLFDRRTDPMTPLPASEIGIAPGSLAE